MFYWIMKKPSLFVVSALNSLGVLAYTSAVAWVMFHGERFFGKMHTFVGPLAILLLFVFSATVVGSLVLGRPAYLYFNGAKTEAVRLLLYTMGWLLLFVLGVFAVLLGMK